ncbi:MAG: hypothetical protein MK106_15465 [Mariniblastus sp.]|nr:hypothetical protein [Mariniblastus sp.]
MRYIFLYTGLGFVLMGLAGCSMCCGPFDFSYPTYGGAFPREMRDAGRVGSVFSDPSFEFSGPSASSNLEAVEQVDPMGLPEDDFMSGFERDSQERLSEPQIDGTQPDNGPVPDDANISARRWQVEPVTSLKNWR